MARSGAVRWGRGARSAIQGQRLGVASKGMAGLAPARAREVQIKARGGVRQGWLGPGRERIGLAWARGVH